MMTKTTVPKPPTDDKRWRQAEVTMRRQGHDPHSLIEALHAIQSAFGFIDETAMAYVAKSLNVPLSKVYGVVTFYHHFSLKPQGKHTCTVCMGTACYIKGNGGTIKKLSEKYGIKEGQTTPDGQLSLVAARCIGACGLAPVSIVDGEVVGKSNADQIIATIERKKAT